MRDPNEPSIYDCGAPYNEDDEGNCACSACSRRRRKEAENKYYEEGNRPDDEWVESRMGWDELSEEGRRRRIERRIDSADMRRDEIRDKRWNDG